MIFIAHRGNTSGPRPYSENSPTYIRRAVELGFNVEVDIRFVDNQFYLGHDTAKYPVDKSFIESLLPLGWFHAKDGLTAVYLLDKFANIICFGHDADPFVLTSNGFMWCHSSNPIISSLSIIVALKYQKIPNIEECAGICSDEVSSFLARDIYDLASFNS